jgi:DNA-directed RNA polymerase specialized sigma subunit
MEQDAPTKLEQQAQMWKTWRSNPTPDTLQPLLTSLDSTIRAALTSNAGGDPKLKVRATILAREALDSYDPTRGALTTHVASSLRRLNRVQAERRTVVRVPENVRLDRLAVTRWVQEYQDKNDGLEPSVQTLAEGLKMSPKRVAKAWSSGHELASSRSLSEKGDDLATQRRTPDEVWADYVYMDLDETNKKIFEHTTGYLGRPKLPKQEIARILKISPPAVSQRITTINKRLSEIDNLPDPSALG